MSGSAKTNLWVESISSYPPATVVYRPEKKVSPAGFLERAFSPCVRMFQGVAGRTAGKSQPFVSLVARHAEGMAMLDEAGIRQTARELSMELHRRGFCKAAAAKSFALIREAAHRFVGMRHYDVQIAGGWAMLNGKIAEMETGEGKTLTATLAAGTAALAGFPVHVISVNDYLTARDAAWMKPVYEAIGLSVGCVTQDAEPFSRRAAYQCDIAYCTNKTVVFDYLRDRIVLRNKEQPLVLQTDGLCAGEKIADRLLQRGLCFGIVDEADSILIDEARTPLIISGSAASADEEAFLRQALTLARELADGRDYRIDFTKRSVELSASGKEIIRERSASFGPLWQASIRREEVVEKALSAIHLFKRDEHYLVDGGKVQIVDEFTGRVMPDRSWEKGLHQLIEIREGCEVTGQRTTHARISYQSFFRRYLRLSGMTGTAREVRKELWDVYRLSVVRIATNRPVVRRYLPDVLFKTGVEKQHAVVARIKKLHAAGRPVLVGTRSVHASEQLSELLVKEEGPDHQVLNAWRVKEEAEIVAGAGKTGAVTIATNMAGRGTDIKLDEDARRCGGLHVILTERHEAGRIDRQLAGRCGRQGDPGSFEAMISMEDDIVQKEKGLWKLFTAILMRSRMSFWWWFGIRAIWRAQRKTERRHANIRKRLLKMDEAAWNMLSFSGKPD